MFEAGTDGDGHDTKAVRWRVRALEKAEIGEMCRDIDGVYFAITPKYWTAMGSVVDVRHRGTDLGEGQTMKLIQTLRNRKEALKVREIASLFGVTPQHIYKMAASGNIPSFRVCGSVRFDPEDLASWLEQKQGTRHLAPRSTSSMAA